MPLDLVLNKDKELASEILSKSAYTNPKDFFNYKPSTRAISAYAELSLVETLSDVSIFTKSFIDFILHLPEPCAFYVRLLDKKQKEFSNVENFFRTVVDPGILCSGYERFEMGADASEEIFLNIELFKKLHSSSLIIVDLTCVRPNCCFEFGYVLALSKKVILTAMEGT